ncbi:MAG: tetratricopeptide repeat protein [Anaerolineales bacterium]|nr:tetratricopeptide repeat protein [Anaerolineales bacterium]
MTRPRLIDLLINLLDKKLVLISAPAGYGKTSFLIDAAAQTDLPYCWLALDELDRDPQRFITYFVASLAECFQGLGKETIALLNTVSSLDDELERLVITLTNEVYHQISEHFVIILDDYHLVDDSSLVQAFLNRFIQLVGENCHLVIASRTLVNLPILPLMIAHDQVEGLDFVELAFRSGEIQMLLAQNYQMNISSQAAEELAEETEGWITGLQFSGQLSSRGMTNYLRVARASGVGVFDYLGQQVLDQQEPALREALLHTSLLEEFNSELCEYVLDPCFSQPQNWSELLNLILEKNLFALPVGVGGQWIRYHHLFRDFLQSCFEEEYPDKKPSILSRLAEYYEQHGDWERAYHIYKHMDDPDLLANMIERAGTPMLQRAVITLEGWLYALPPSTFHKRPALLSLHGAILNLKGQVEESRDIYNQAEVALREQGNIPELTRTLVRRAVCLRDLGQYNQSLDDTDEVLNLIAASDDLRPIYAEALRVKGTDLFRLGQVRQAIDVMQRSLSIFANLDYENSIAILHMELGSAYFAIGNYEKARTSFEKALAIWQQSGNLSWQANVLNNLGVLYHLQGEYEKAILTLEKGLSCSRRSSSPRLEALLLTSMGDAYYDLDEYKSARKAYQKAREISQHIADHFLLNYLPVAMAKVERLDGNIEQAHQLLDSVKNRISDSQYNQEDGLYSLEMGCLLLSEEKQKDAHKHLLNAEEYFRAGDLFLEMCKSKLWLTVSYLKLEDMDSAREELKTVLEMMETSTSIYPLYTIVRQASQRLSRLQNGTEVGKLFERYVRKAEQLGGELAAVRRRLRHTSNEISMSTPWLSIRAFGKAQVKINGKALTLKDWQTKSVRDLFFFFLSYPQPMTKEQLSYVFWPDIEDPGKLKLRFKNDLYRLRRAVGHEVILFDDERYSFNRTVDHEFDIEAFETHIRLTQQSRIFEEKISHYQNALDLVKGPYLTNIDAAWVEPERERLKKEYLTAAITLAELYLETDNLQQSLETCQWALKHDPCFEQSHRLIMRINSLRGDRPAIVRQYQLCKKALETELDLPPSLETENLYRQLTTS